MTGDFNRDGKQDVIAVCASSATQPGTLAVMLGKGDGAFQTSYVALPGPLIPQGIGSGITAALAAADFNGDGKLDIAVVMRGGGTNSIGVLLGDGQGGFAAPGLSTTTAAPPMMAAADVDGDGFPDSDPIGLLRPHRNDTAFWQRRRKFSDGIPLSVRSQYQGTGGRRF